MDRLINTKDRSSAPPKMKDEYQTEVERVRQFYLRKLEELAKKSEARVRAARSSSYCDQDHKKTNAFSRETELLRAENEVLRVRLQEVFPGELFLYKEVADQTYLRHEAASAEKFRLQASRLADKVKQLEKANSELRHKLEKAEKAYQRSSSQKVIADRLQLLEERVEARERTLERILKERDDEIVDILEYERSKFTEVMSEKNAQLMRCKSQLAEVLEYLQELGLDFPTLHQD